MTPERCLSLSIQLIDVIEYAVQTGNSGSALEPQIYLFSLVQSLIEYGYDPRNAFSAIVKMIQSTDEYIGDGISDYMIITMSNIIHNIAPFYLRNALDVLKVKLKIHFH